MKGIRTVVFIAFCLVAVMARAYTLSGKVSTDSREPLPFVSVYLKDVHLGATTDLDGKYIIRDIPAGHHTLVVSYVGYETQAFGFDMEKDGVRDFTLHEQSITLDEVFITPTGESLERFILGQVVKNSRKLSKRVVSFRSTQEARMEQRNNNMKVVVEPYLKIMNLTLGILGYRDILNAIMNHPDFRLEIRRDNVFEKGILTVADARITHCNPEIDRKESDAWVKFYSKRRDNEYDAYYDKIAGIWNEIGKMDKKNPGESARHLTYNGSYDENGNTVHIIRYDRYQFHIVDGCWQIRRMVEEKDSKGHSLVVEFHELARNVYMPVSKYSELDFSLEKFLNDELEELKKEDTSSMNPRQLARHNDRRERIEAVLKSGMSMAKTSTTFIYRNFKANTDSQP